MSGIDSGTDFSCLCELGQADGDHDYFVWAVSENRFNTFDEFGIEFTYRGDDYCDVSRREGGMEWLSSWFCQKIERDGMDEYLDKLE